MDAGRSTAGTSTLRAGRWTVVLPALTFVVGLLLGGAVAAVSQVADSTPAGPVAGRSPSPTASAPAPTPVPTNLVVPVPAACLAAAEKAQTAFEILDQAANAIRDVDARRLQELVDRVQDEQPDVEALVGRCRAAAGTGAVDSRPAPAATPSPTS